MWTTLENRGQNNRGSLLSTSVPSKCKMHKSMCLRLPLQEQFTTIHHVQGLLMNKQKHESCQRWIADSQAGNFFTHEADPLANREETKLQSTAESHCSCTNPADHNKRQLCSSWIMHQHPPNNNITVGWHVSQGYNRGDKCWHWISGRGPSDPLSWRGEYRELSSASNYILSVKLENVRQTTLAQFHP